MKSFLDKHRSGMINHPMVLVPTLWVFFVRLICIVAFAASVNAALSPSAAATLQINSAAPNQAYYDLGTALAKGAVDLSSDRWSGHGPEDLIRNLAVVDPGLVNRFAFFYGGPTAADLEVSDAIAKQIHAVLPKALLGATLPELVGARYDEVLTCGSDLKRRFTADQVGLRSRPDGLWVDPAVALSRDYYLCLGHHAIDRGFTFIHFENSAGVLDNAPLRDATIAGYRAVALDLKHYGAERGLVIYVSGGPPLAGLLPLDAVYLPSRFYHVSPGLDAYQNRISRPGIGVGYSYSLSQKIIDDTKTQVPETTHILFYVDNWDASQDDLRRFLELDDINRRFLIKTSTETAQRNHVTFVAPLDTCVGCVPPQVVGSACEILPDRRTEYNAFFCGDLLALKGDRKRQAP